jgi:hypothetical protein
LPSPILNSLHHSLPSLHSILPILPYIFSFILFFPSFCFLLSSFFLPISISCYFLHIRWWFRCSVQSFAGDRYRRQQEILSDFSKFDISHS